MRIINFSLLILLILGLIYLIISQKTSNDSEYKFLENIDIHSIDYILKIENPDKSISNFFESEYISNQITKYKYFNNLEKIFNELKEFVAPNEIREFYKINYKNKDNEVYVLVLYNSLDRAFSIKDQNYKFVNYGKSLLISKDKYLTELENPNKSILKDILFEKSTSNDHFLLIENNDNKFKVETIKTFPQSLIFNEIVSKNTINEQIKDQNINNYLKFLKLNNRIIKFKNKNFLDYNDILSKINKKCKCDIEYSLFKNLENSFLYYENLNGDKTIISKANNIYDLHNNLQNLISDSLLDSSIRIGDNEIYKFEDKYNIKQLFDVEKMKMNYYSIIMNSYLIISENVDEIKYFLTENEQINKNENFIKFKSFIEENFIKDAKSITIYKGLKHNFGKSDTGVSIVLSSYISGNKIFNQQIFSSKINMNGYIPNPIWIKEFENNFKGKIFFSENHKTNTKDILIQDENFVLHSFNLNGVEKWNYKLDGEIIKEIANIDYYNNGKKQILVSTQNSLYIIDVNGSMIEGFPIKYQFKTNNQIAVIEYDTKSNYRFLISSNEGIMNYDKKGNKIDGWTKWNFKNSIKTKIKYLKYGQKDYIIANNNDDGKFIIMNRKGENISVINKKISLLNDYEIIFGNNIQNTRILYFDFNKNSYMYFNFNKNEDLKTLIDFDDKINNYEIVNYNDDISKEYVFYSNNSLIIYNSKFSLIKKLNINTNNKLYKFNKNKIYELDKAQNSLYMINENNKKVLINNNIEDFEIIEHKESKFILAYFKNKIMLIEIEGKL